MFPAAGATNYTAETLELACSFFYEFPEKLKNAVLNNYLVNPTGQEFGWYEHDLLQEHHNLMIKRVFNQKNVDFGSDFLRKAVAINIRKFGDLRERFFGMLGLRERGVGRGLDEAEADIRALSTHYQEEETHIFMPGRKQSYCAIDSIRTGMEKLANGGLKAFLARTATIQRPVNTAQL